MDRQLCMGCMRPIEPGEAVCPACGRRHDARPGRDYVLQPGVVLYRKFLVGDVIGDNGISITYIGYDTLMEQKVVILEYFPRQTGMVARGQNGSMAWSNAPEAESIRKSGAADFIQSARKQVAMADVPEVASVRNAFMENNTAYVIMDWADGENFKSVLMREGPMDFDRCVRLLAPVIRAMHEAHQKGILHLNISPDTLYVQNNGKLLLTRLGTLQSMVGQNYPPMVKSGFSPPEQYRRTEPLGSWSDVYAMCAMILYCCTGKLPPKALDRLQGDTLAPHPRLTAEQFQVLSRGLAVEKENRIQTMDELLRQLMAAIPAVQQPPVAPPVPNIPNPSNDSDDYDDSAPSLFANMGGDPPAPAEPGKKKKGNIPFILGILAIVFAIVCTAYGLTIDTSNRPGSGEETEAVAEATEETVEETAEETVEETVEETAEETIEQSGEEAQ